MSSPHSSQGRLWRRWVRRILLAVLILVVVAYAGAIGALRLHEKLILYQAGDRQVGAPDPRFSLHERRVTYPSTDNVMLSAWIVPASPDHPSDMWVLMCHGNYGSIGYGERPEFYAKLRGTGVNILAFDYRGFGESTGEADEQGLYADATASYRYLTQTLRVPASHLIVWGHSLGSGVAIELASREPAAGLVVEGAYTSIVARGQARYPYLPIDRLATQRFPSIDRIAHVNMPKLFLHSPEDAVIPYADGRRLFAAASEPKRFVDVKGGHELAFRVDSAVYFRAVADFIRRDRPTD